MTTPRGSVQECPSRIADRATTFPLENGKVVFSVTMRGEAGATTSATFSARARSTAVIGT